MPLYNFETQATFFVGERGQNALRLEGDYDILLTNRLILQPTAEVNAYTQNDPGRGIGSGLANTEAGVRLQYEIVGVSWNRSYSNTADYAREDGDDTRQTRFVADIRLWF